PIVVNGHRLGTAQITTQPMDEIDEIWGYARALSAHHPGDQRRDADSPSTSPLGRILAAPAALGADLIMPPIERHVLPIVVNGHRLGTAQITTQPMDEIDEIWGYARALS
ncbi:ATPase, partial [Methylobacterium radiotolerans]